MFWRSDREGESRGTGTPRQSGVGVGRENSPSILCTKFKSLCDMEGLGMAEASRMHSQLLGSDILGAAFLGS